MPEIGEIARLTHYLKKHLLGRTIAAVKVQDDPIIYGKAGTSAAEFQKSITGKKVVDVGQQGKYFWMIMSSPPHPLLHCSMTGWIKFSNDDSSYYKPTKTEDASWPPRFWKFVLEAEGQPKCEAAFVDARRLGRIRLVDCEGGNIRNVLPLNANGPDPVVDKEKLTRAWFVQRIQSKRVPVKAFLLDQGMISGVGNWVADEILYHARIHPEQYTNSLSDSQLKQLHESLLHICSTAVGTLADSSKFPEEWLMKHRWGKGKQGNKLPNGERITHITVGGRTSAVVPSLQKKTGPVAGDVESAESEEEEVKDEVTEEKTTPAKSKTSKTISKKDSNPAKPTSKSKRKALTLEEVREGGEPAEDRPKSSSKKQKTKSVPNGTRDKRSEKRSNVTDRDSGRRRSARIKAA